MYDDEIAGAAVVRVVKLEKGIPEDDSYDALKKSHLGKPKFVSLNCVKL